MNEFIKADLYRYIPEPFSLLNLFKGFKSQGFRYIFLKRKLDNCRKGSLSWYFWKIILRHYTYKYGFQIGGQIGKGFFIGHFGTIVINPGVTIGENCNIAHTVTIGAARRGIKAGVPVIGNNVWIGTGCVIVGKIKVGNNVLLAPNAYVNFDVPDNSVVLGNPGIIKHKPNATQGYINNAYS